MRKLKKGFTIIELVIVIAVIAVLTAVLVPTFVHLSKKARDTNDKSIVTSANIQLAAQEGLQGKNRSMSEAVKDVDEIGYHMSTVPTGNGNKIVWDSVSDRFVLLDKDNNVLLSDGAVSSHDKLFYPTSSDSEAGDFAIYAKSDYSGITEFTSAKSFDAGDKEDITSISYSFTSEGSLLVATNSADTVLSVYAPNGEFTHAGLCGKILITAVKGDTFAEHGKIGYVKLESGHYVADAGSNVKAIYVSDNAGKVDRLNGGVIENAYGKDNTVTNNGHNVPLDTSGEKSESQIEEQAISDLNHDINPPVPLAGSPISNFDELKQAFADGGEYYLTDNILVTSEVKTTTETTIDFNGHYLNIDAVSYQGYGCVLVAYSSSAILTFKDSSENGTGGVFNVSDDKNDAVVGIFSGGHLVIESGTILSTENASIGGVGGFMNPAGSITINGGHLNGYIGELTGTVIYVNTACSFAYKCDYGISLANFDTSIVTGPGVTQVSGDIHSSKTTFVFVKA